MCHSGVCPFSYLIFFDFFTTAHYLLYQKINSMTSKEKKIFFRSQKIWTETQFSGQIGNEFWNGVDEYFHGNGNFIRSVSHTGHFLEYRICCRIEYRNFVVGCDHGSDRIVGQSGIEVEGWKRLFWFDFSAFLSNWTDYHQS